MFITEMILRLFIFLIGGAFFLIGTGAAIDSSDPSILLILVGITTISVALLLKSPKGQQSSHQNIKCRDQRTNNLKPDHLKNQMSTKTENDPGHPQNQKLIHWLEHSPVYNSSPISTEIIYEGNIKWFSKTPEPLYLHLFKMSDGTEATAITGPEILNIRGSNLKQFAVEEIIWIYAGYVMCLNAKQGLLAAKSIEKKFCDQAIEQAEKLDFTDCVVHSNIELFGRALVSVYASKNEQSYFVAFEVGCQKEHMLIFECDKWFEHEGDALFYLIGRKTIGAISTQKNTKEAELEETIYNLFRLTHISCMTATAKAAKLPPDVAVTLIQDELLKQYSKVVDRNNIKDSLAEVDMEDHFQKLQSVSSEFSNALKEIISFSCITMIMKAGLTQDKKMYQFLQDTLDAFELDREILSNIL